MPLTTELLRVLVVVRQWLLAKVLCDSLAGENLLVVGSCRSAMQLDLSALHPDVILLDLDTCEKNVSRVLRECREKLPGARVCVFVSNPDDPQLRCCIEQRVEGCIVTDVPFDAVVEAVKSVAQGDVFIDRRISRHLLARRYRHSEQDNLSQREEQIVRMLVQGLANKEIAYDLKISQSTVKNHVSRIFEKLSVSSRTEAAVLAVKVGLI